MAIQFRNYTSEAGITEDYFKVRSFFVELGHSEFTYARWDWMTTHSYLDKNAVGKIGLWEDEDRVVGVATFDMQLGMKRSNVDLNLKVAVVGPGGHFVSYCGMWYDEKAGFAVIEPVATDPEYRRMGLGKAAVLEGIRRVGALGAKNILVGSSQQFYYSIGMRPFATASVWKMLK